MIIFFYIGLGKDLLRVPLRVMKRLDIELSAKMKFSVLNEMKNCSEEMALGFRSSKIS